MPIEIIEPPSAVVDDVAVSLIELFQKVIEAVRSDSVESIALKNETLERIRRRLVTLDTAQQLLSEAQSSQPPSSNSVLFYVTQGLKSSAARDLRLITLRQLLLLASTPTDAIRRTSVSALAQAGLVQQAVRECFLDETCIDVSQAAARFLARLATDPLPEVADRRASVRAHAPARQIAAAFFNDAVVAPLVHDARSDTLAMRVFELLVDVFVADERAAERVEAHDALAGALRRLVDVLASDDVLLTMAAVELVVPLCSAPQGIAWCERQQILSRFHDSLAALPSDALEQMYTARVVKCLGDIVASSVYRQASVALDATRFALQFAAALSEARAHANDELAEALIVALNKAATALAPDVLVLFASTFCNVIKEYCQSPRVSLAAASLNALATYLRSADRPQTCYELMGVDQQPMARFLVHTVLADTASLKHARRCAAFNFLGALATWEWGAVALLRDAEFRKLVADGFSEANLEAKEWKFGLIQSLLEHEQCDDRGAIPSEIWPQLKSLRALGPFGVPSEPQPIVGGGEAGQ